eukprot:scaffold10761_cov62-Phaeocystis_antarctica.AAC.4
MKEPARVHARLVLLTEGLEHLLEAAPLVVDRVLELWILHALDLGDVEMLGATVIEVETIDTRCWICFEDGLHILELVAVFWHLDAQLMANKARSQCVRVPAEAILSSHALGRRKRAR